MHGIAFVTNPNFRIALDKPKLDNGSFNPPTGFSKNTGSPCYHIIVQVVDKNNPTKYLGKIVGQSTSIRIIDEVVQACHINARGRPWVCKEKEVNKRAKKPCDDYIRFEFKDKINS